MIRAVRGMNDITPSETPYWQHVEGVARDVLVNYGYEEIRPPVMERTELFRRSIGEITDIVQKEMYTFSDRNGDSLTLRPEATAGCVRASVEHGLLRSGIQRLWYMGPMFRHERPQKERYRQFYQVDVEAFGMPGPDIDAELILMTARLWRMLGLSELTLELNSLGSVETQATYKGLLTRYFSERRESLDEDSRRRLNTNPLRILDSKNPEMLPVIEECPKILDRLDTESSDHFTELRSILEAAGVPYTVNACLVRGLDYYTRTVFEWTSNQLGSQGTVCGGGRYDNLVAQIGGPDTPAIGFAMGLERLISLLRNQGTEPPLCTPHVYLAAVTQDAAIHGYRLSESLRDRLPGLRLLVDSGPGSFKSKLKRADRSGARVALILGDDETRSARVNVKFLRESTPQKSLTESALPDLLQQFLTLNSKS